MSPPVQVTFKNVPFSEALNDRIMQESERLAHYYHKLQDFRVVVEVSHKHHAKGSLFHIHLVAHIPGDTLVVTKESHNDHSHEDAYVAVRDAFDALHHQLDHAEKK